jgi:hypothetical protein
MSGDVEAGPDVAQGDGGVGEEVEAVGEVEVAGSAALESAQHFLDVVVEAPGLKRRIEPATSASAST